MHATISLQDAYPEKPCLFDLALFNVGMNKGDAKISEFTDGIRVESLLLEIKFELEEHCSAYCDAERMQDFLFSF